MTKKLKRNLSILTLALVLSCTIFGNVSAKGNDVTQSNSTPNSIQKRIGGGPSDSAMWEKKKSYYANFTHEQLGQLNRIYNNMVSSSSYSRGQTVYNASLAIAGFLPGINVGAAYQSVFGDCYYSLIQQSANVVNQRYMQGGTRALYVTEYCRPASGETFICLSNY